VWFAREKGYEEKEDGNVQRNIMQEEEEDENNGKNAENGKNGRL
jgi:hypothetical protein